MKKIYFVLVGLLTAVNVVAQSETGKFYVMPKIGIGLSNQSGHFWNSDVITPGYDINQKIGFEAGVEVEYRATKLLGLAAGVFYAQQGTKLEKTYLWKSDAGHDVVSDANGKIKQNYINIPVLANFYVYKGLALKAGLQFGFKTKSEFNVKEEGTCLYIPGMEIYDACGDDYKRFSEGEFNGNGTVVSVPVGVSYEYAGVVLDVRYNIGITKSADEYHTYNVNGVRHIFDVSLKNNCLQVMLGYKFRL